MAYSVEKDLEQMGRKNKASAKRGDARRAKLKAKAKPKAKAKAKPKKKKGETKENWAQRLKRNVQMMLKGEKYKVPDKKKSSHNSKGKSGGY